jgi:hypothetical protein
MFMDPTSPALDGFGFGGADKHNTIMSPIIKDSPNPFGSPAGFSPVEDFLDMQTISPAQMFSSVPMSHAMSHLTTPSECFDSPLFPTNDDFDNWENDPLFPDAEKIDGTTVNPSFFSPSAPAMERNFSSTSSKASNSPSSIGFSGISKVKKNARKRVSLPPLDPSKAKDPTELKRIKNTAAARKSREKKAKLVDDLESQVDALTKENLELRNELAEFKRMYQAQQTPFFH